MTAQDGDYTFSRPADWSDVADLTIPVDTSVSPTTLAALGASSGATIKVDFAKNSAGTTGVSAWTLDKVTTPTADLFPSELAWLKTQPQIKTVDDDSLSSCIDGSLAQGFRSTWTTAQGDTTFVIYLLTRNGKMYETQLSTRDPNGVDTFGEVLRTWKWSEPETAGGPSSAPAGSIAPLEDQLAGTKFASIGASDVADESGDHPNAATFKSALARTLKRIYVVYELDDGVSDTVVLTWNHNGDQIATKTYDYGSSTAFAWTWLTPPSGGFRTGTYDVTATLKNAGDSVTIRFEVE